MAELSILIDLLFQDKPSDDLAQRIQSDSFKSGLENFYAVLQRGIDNLGDGNLGFESWNQSQIQAVCSIASSIAYATRFLSVEHTEPIIIAILQQSLELALNFLEKPLLSYDDINLQNNMVLLLEVALLDGMDKNFKPSFSFPVNILTQLLQSLDISCAKPELVNVKCNIQEGFSCSKEEKPVDQLFLTLVSDFMHGESQTLQFTESILHQKLIKLVSLSQHWAVVHMGCIQRLLFVFKDAIKHPDMLDERTENANSIKKLSFSLRILKLLGNLVKYLPCIGYDHKLFEVVASCADGLPGLFRTGYDFFADSSFESLLLLTIEEFLYVVQVVFCNSSVFQNIQACIVASILDNLDCSIWRCHKYSSILKPPLAYSPQTVMFILKLVKNIKKQNWKEFSIGQTGGSAAMEVELPFCNVHSTKVFLLHKYTVEELLRLVFPSSKQWVDNLVHLVCFLHTECVKLSPKLERSHFCSAKGTCTSELESSVYHDDEPLFGDLFSEGSRSVASNDDPVLPTVSSIFSCDNMLCQAATELLLFLKDCIFSPDCHPFLYEDASKKLTKDHIDILLSILRCQACSSEDRNPDNITLHELKTIGHTHKLCFELLRKIITSHILSDIFKEHLVEQILNIENGAFIYNDEALALLGQTLICAGGFFGSQLRIKIYKVSVDYIVEKAKSVQFKCPNNKEVIEALPSLFHIEILLMAFHLSPENEKVKLAKFVFSSIKEIDAPNPCSNNLQLTCWGLLISRLILMLRHMIYYHHTRPSSLLLDLMSRLREAPLFLSRRSVSESNNLFFWTSTVVECLFGEDVRDHHIISSIVNQLIDISAFPASVCRDDLSIHCLQLNWDDVYATLLRILNAWNNNKAASVEDLIIERYMFVICWDFPSTSSAVNLLPPSQSDLLGNDLSNVELFFLLSHLFLGQCLVIRESIDLPNLVVSVLHKLHGAHISNNIENLGWGFLRNGLCLSLILCLLDTGNMAYQLRNAIHPPAVGHRKHKSKDDDYLTLAEGLISDIFNGSQVTDILKILSCLLSYYLQTYQKTFLCVLKSQHSFDGFSPLMLLKHTWFDIILQNDLFEKNKSSSFQLKSVCGLLQKLDSFIERRASGIVSEVFWKCMLHGFPFQFQTTSGFLLSCILSIRGIIAVLNGFVSIMGVKKNVCVEYNVLCQILDLVMTIKFDRIFESLHEKCESIYHNLSGGLDGPGYNYLFPMKQLEGFLREINASDVMDIGIHEWIVAKLFDSMDILRKDPLRAVVFKFYIGAEYDESKRVKDLYELQHVDLMVLIDVLVNYFAEFVNVKVLTFFVDVLSGEFCSLFKLLIQRKFLGMDLHLLSKWLENRLVGCMVEISGGLSTVKGSSNCLRECTMDFILCIVSPSGSCGFLTMELYNHLFEAMLVTLDIAFIQFDIHIAKSYFHFVVQLSNVEHLMKSLLNRIVILIEKLSGGDEGRLPVLKFLFNFLGSVLSDCGFGKVTIDKSTMHFLPKNSIGIGSMAPKMVGLWKSSETLVLPSNQEGSTIECDATSIDEDEDDGTSDGDVAGIDRDGEDDINSEKALASKVCTFTSSGSNFMEQHWYFCYTCDLVASKGCCSVCAKVCHRGHRVVYSRSSRFFCDCGAGGVLGSNCQCLKPRKFTGSNNVAPRSAASFQHFLPFTEDAVQLPDSDSDMDEDVCMDVDNLFKLSISKELQVAIPVLLHEADIEGRVLKLCSSLLPSVISRDESTFEADKKFLLGEDMLVSYGVDLLQLKKAYKSGSLDLKIKSDYSNAKELKTHLSDGSLFKSLLSISIRGRLAVGEGDRVAIFDAGQLIGQATVAPVTADKANIKPLSKNILRFEIVHLIFNPLVENYLAVAGYEDCQVLTINHRGEVTDRLPIEIALEGSYVRRVDWVPGSQVELLIVTNKFVKIYDLSQDSISPVHCFTLSDDLIVDATLLMASHGKFLLVLSELGNLLKLELTVESSAGAKQMNEIVTIQGSDKPAKGLSLFYSSTYRLLFVSYQNSNTIVGRFDSSVTSLTEISSIYEDDQGVNLRPAGLHHWKELVCDSGLFSCFSSLKSNAAVTLSIGPHGFYAQNMRHAIGSTSKLIGLTAYKPLSRDKIHLIVLHDDGSLQIYSHSPIGVDVGPTAASEKIKKLGSDILNKAYVGMNPEFPLDFFERAVCITADVKLSGDSIRVTDLEGIKLQLSSEDGFIESASALGFKITVSNSNPDIVMVGIRVCVGNTSPNHIPSNITIFHRMIKFDEGMRSWYDIPFTVAESLLADEEFTFSVGPTFSGSILPRIDSLEVYGRAKDEFGWKEKMDTVLVMESRSQGCNSWMPGSRKKTHSMESSPIEDQVLADALKFLSKFYSLSRSEGCTKFEEVKMELSMLKCRQLLETIFETDREPFLQSAACLVLQAVFPKKEIYSQVKDTMHILGVLKSTAVISSKLRVGGSLESCIIKDFTAQIHAVTRIAMHQRSRSASFLEMNGSEVIDKLMQILWVILDVEQLDTQTINNIVVSSVELIYCYAECLSLLGKSLGDHPVAPAVELLKKLLFSSNEAIQTSSSLAISSRLLQMPFPRQSLLVTDDAVDNTMLAGYSSENTGINNQVMVEEDPITSSVQYCCDGCSIVPILRQRWHCTICPDFDLCEACYEVLDGERLPPPHSRDHPMSALPIESDSLGGDVNELQFSTDESNMFPVAPDSSVQTSTPPIHVLEPTESVEFSASVVDPVLISASKQAVNSLILVDLLEKMKGWMETTSGVQAIPIMQLFYRLSSSVGGPFINSSNYESVDMEKLIKWFLGEININRSFAASSRSSFGEVTILVFMFITLMLRNWHQPGSESSTSKSTVSLDTHERSVLQIQTSAPIASQVSISEQGKNDFASQLLRASSALRQQAFVNYLMDILLQLVHVFKSSTVNFENAQGPNPGSGCGSLLTVRRDLPAGNFSPFFSDSYAKAHRQDIFMDYHRLLLENVFRLLYSLIRPEKHDKTSEKEKSYRFSSSKDLKLDGYQDVLCSYINNPRTTFVRRYARRLFLHLCGSKTHYYSVRDTWQFSSEVKRLFKHVKKYGGIQNPVPYDRAVKMVKCLSTMADVAAARPRNWQKYCFRHSGVLPFLLNGVFHFGEESAFQTLKLLNLAFFIGKDANHSFLQKPETMEPGMSLNKSGPLSLDSKKKRKGEDGNEAGLDKSSIDMEAAVDIFTDKGGDVLRQFIDCFLLEWNSSYVRVEAKCTLHGAWHHGKQSFKESMLVALLQKVKCLPVFGQNIVEYTELLTWLLGKISVNNLKQQCSELLDHCLNPDLIRCIFDTLHVQNELLANHPNSRIYNTLNGLIEFDGYYLESEPCVACNSPEMSYSKMKLESLKSETKFTGNRIIVKCSGSYSIQTITMNVHDGRKSKSVKVLNLYYNNRPISDLSELKNNRLLWKRAKSSHLAFNQTELKVDFPIPITACNLMIELDSFYENLQALSLEPLQCPRCSRSVTDKHGICGNCHENAYQCRQCRNINYENLDSFLCNECGYSKYGRFEFNFMAKPSFSFDIIENDDDMKRALAAIESESENAHKRYQQLLGFKKPLLKIVSSIGENEMDSQQKDSVQQMMVCLPPSKINRKISLLGVLYGEKCKAAFDSVSKSVQTLQGLRRVLMNYLHQKHSESAPKLSSSVFSRLPNNCYGCATAFVAQCLEILHELAKHPNSKKQLVAAGILSELFENNIHQGPKSARVQTRAVLCSFSEGDSDAVAELNKLIQTKVMYCLEHHRSLDIALATREELLLLSDVCSLTDEFWESRLRVVFHLFFSSIKLGAKHPTISEHVILPCLRIIAQACTPPTNPDTTDRERGKGKSPLGPLQKDELNISSPGSRSAHIACSKPVTESNDKDFDVSNNTQDIRLLSYSEWERGATYLDFVRRQYKLSQVVRGPGQNSLPKRYDHLDMKYALRWKRRACKTAKSDLSAFELGSWVADLVLNPCSQSIRSEMCMLISSLCAQSSYRQLQLLNLFMDLFPATLSVGESAAEYFELLFKMLDSEDARLFLTVQGCLSKICNLITKEVGQIESLERSLHIDITQGFILHKLIELLGKILEVPNISARFLRDNLLSEVLEALIVIRGLVVQKTKLIGDCHRLLNVLLDNLLLGSSENKKQFIRACIRGLQIHMEERNSRTTVFILEQLCNLICPSKPETVYLLVLTKAHTQEEFMRGSMTKNPYSSAEIGPLMRDVKNKICHQLDLLGLLEDDYGMELLVAGNIISLDLGISQVYEQVWKKSNIQTSTIVANSSLSTSPASSAKDNPPMTVTYRLQGLDGEATEPMIKELDEDREEFQDPEVEFAIVGAVREFGGLEIILAMIQSLRDDLKSNQEQLVAVLKLLMHCCKIKENVRVLLRLGALGLLLETARFAFSMDALESAEGILLIVESLTLEANDSDDISIRQSALMATSEASGAGDQAKKIVLMFLERISHPSGLKMSNKQHRNTEMVARILPYLTYGEPAAMDALIHYFDPYLHNWGELDRLIKLCDENPKDETILQQAAKQRFVLENFVRVSESLKTSSCGDTLKDIILKKGITSAAVRHIRESFGVARQAVFKSSNEWALGLKLPSIPLILSMLKGLSMGHLGTQMCIDEGGILALLHALEGVSGENEIGAKAENLLDTLSDKDGNGDGFLMDKVQKLRHATRDEMRRRALKMREETLQGLGWRHVVGFDGGDRIMVSQPILEGLEDVEEEEDGVACMVCREGYSLRPSDMLGVYTYTKRVSLGLGVSGSSRGECVYTTVSHFNIIHFQCHQEAKRADAALRTPKKEWEGATLRNNETLCNSLFPVRGPLVPAAQYSRYVDQYWDSLNMLGRADGTRLRLLTYDIVLMLARFATGASFSIDCKGGGKESNSRFLPFMIQMAHHLLHQGNPGLSTSTLTKSISTYLSASSSPESKSTAQEAIQYMMVNSLLLESYDSWDQRRHIFLQRGIHHAYMQHSHRGGSEGGDLLGIVQPMLVYVGLVEQLQRFFKVRESGEDWEVVMREKVMNTKELVGLGKELVMWVEEMLRAGCLYDAFGMSGMLGDVLMGEFATCEEFVEATIHGGKS